MSALDLLGRGDDMFKWIPLPIKEWLPDQPPYEVPGTQVARNVVAASNSYKPFTGVEVFSDAMPTASDDYVRGAIALRDQDRITHIYAGDASKLYELSATAWDDVSKSGNYSGTATTEIWDFDQWGNTVIATNFNNVPQQITMGGASFADLPGSPPRARYVSVIKDFVVLASLLEAGTNQNARVRWSAFNNSDIWTPSVTLQSDFQDIQKGGAITGIEGGESGLIFQEEQINHMVYEGPPRIFRFDVPSQEIGCRVPGSITRYGANVFFIGDADFYIIGFGTEPKPLGQNKWARYFHKNFDRTFLHRVIGSVDVTRKLILLSYPDKNSNNGTPNKTICYNLETNRFTEISEEYVYLFTGLGVGYTLEGLDALYSSVEDIQLSLDDPFWTGGQPKLTAITTANRLGFFEGAPLPARVDTEERRAGLGRKMEINNIRPLVEGFNANVAIRVGTREHQDQSVTYSQQIKPNSDGECNILTEARFARIRIETSGSFQMIQGSEVHVREGGQY